MTSTRLIFKKLSFTGPSVVQADLVFEDGLNLLYGASNTGKSFTLKALDFMLGGDELTEFRERDGYDQIWLGISLKGIGDFTLTSSIKGGAYGLYEGLITRATTQPLRLTRSKPTKTNQSLSQFLLGHLGFPDRVLAKNADGETHKLSFRDLANISLVDEISIQSERSPIENGQVVTRTKERSVFKLLLTGLDDSSLISVGDDKTFATSKAVRIEVIQQLLEEINSQILEEYPEPENLAEQYSSLSASLDSVQKEIQSLQISTREFVDKKRALLLQIPQIGQRLDEIVLHIERFNRLDDIYRSDIDRLTALEEASFLLTLGEGRPCSLCGAAPEFQNHLHEIDTVKLVQEASTVEVEKIKAQREDLKEAIVELKAEKLNLEEKLPLAHLALEEVDLQIKGSTPEISSSSSIFQEIVATRDHVRQGLALLQQKADFQVKITDFENQERPDKADRPNLKAPSSVTHEFAQVVLEVLAAWKFPGITTVSFDEKTYDLLIDGKLRTHNGKGVRAVTHAAFKVALLIFCERKGLPHPGFVVLDTPLLTYRDPLKNVKAGKLTADEQLVAKTELKQRFFEHLASLDGLGQFIVFENIDPPQGIENIAHVEAFSVGEGDGRAGLFPVNV